MDIKLINSLESIQEDQQYTIVGKLAEAILALAEENKMLRKRVNRLIEIDRDAYDYQVILEKELDRKIGATYER